MKTLTHQELARLSLLTRAVCRTPAAYAPLTDAAATQPANRSPAMQTAINHLRAAFDREFSRLLDQSPTPQSLNRVVMRLWDYDHSLANTVADAVSWSSARMFATGPRRLTVNSARRMADAAELEALHATWFTMAWNGDPCADALKDGVLALALRISRRAVKRGKQ